MLVLPPIEEKEAGEINGYPVFYWNHAGLEMNRITHSLSGPQGGPTMSSRALGLLHLAMHDAYFIALDRDETSTPPTYLPNAVRDQLIAAVKSQYPDSPGGSDPVRAGDLANANRALTGAAVAMLDRLYARPDPNISIVASDTLTGALDRLIAGYAWPIDVLNAAHRLGAAVAGKIFDLLGVKPGEPGADKGRYEPKSGRYYFRDEPLTPVRPFPIDPNDPSRGIKAVKLYHGPVYGITVEDFAVKNPDAHRIKDWPKPDADGMDQKEYLDALHEVIALGGARGLGSTTRKTEQTIAAYYWAYDGANLIGTPPRLYNQIIRIVAWNNKLPVAPGVSVEELARTSDFVRVLALANVAMADAGKYAWREKYRFELWRPLSGVREHGPGGDPFWEALGAPETNTDKVSFKPPFPAYPSGHATFGAAAFQMLRLHYWKRAGKKPVVLKQIAKEDVTPDMIDFQDPGDELKFDFVSEELNGISRDLRQAFDPSKPIEDQQGNVRTRIERHFPHLWDAIFENAVSRIYLGVHWRYDAADYGDTGDAKGYKEPNNIRYSGVWPRAPGDVLPTGGIPLGLGIANDIFMNDMKYPGDAAAAAKVCKVAGVESLAKFTNSTYRAAP